MVEGARLVSEMRANGDLYSQDIIAAFKELKKGSDEWLGLDKQFLYWQTTLLPISVFFRRISNDLWYKHK
jgi:hypothetical protein